MSLRISKASLTKAVLWQAVAYFLLILRSRLLFLGSYCTAARLDVCHSLMLSSSPFYLLIYVTIGMCHHWNVPPLAPKSWCGFSTLLLRGLLSIELIAFYLRNIHFSRAEFKGCQNTEVAGSLHHQKLLLWGQARGSRWFCGEGPGISAQICLCPLWSKRTLSFHSFRGQLAHPSILLPRPTSLQDHPISQLFGADGYVQVFRRDHLMP